jgi:serine protease Do
MRNRVAGAVSAAALVLVSAGATPAAAQAQDRLVDVLQLIGPGSTIGVTIDEVNADEAAKAKLGQPEGVIIRTVQNGSAAARAGLRTGDVVVEFDGERVRSSRQFQRLVQETPPNRTVKATIVRDGSRQTLDITPQTGRADGDVTQKQWAPFIDRPNLRVQPQPQPLPSQPPTPRRFQVLPQTPFSLPPQEGRLGAAIMPVVGQLASYFGVKGGALVESVNANSPAEAAGLRAGDVITAVGGREISTPEQVIEAVRNAQAGSVLELTVIRDKKTVQLKATLPSANQPARNDPDRIRL